MARPLGWDGTGELPDIMLRKIDPDGPDGCWLWEAATVTGYGVLRVRGRNVLAHRIMAEWAYGPIPDGYEVDHLCRVRACVRPSHLDVVTGAENRRRAGTKLRCLRGHLRTGNRSKYGNCLTCQKGG